MLLTLSFFTKFLLFMSLGFELQFELATDETVVSAALRTGLYSHVKSVFQIPLAYKPIVIKVLMIGSRIH